MKANEIISIINSNIDTINSSEDKISVIIELLEKHKPSLDLNKALFGSTEDFCQGLSAISDVTPYVIKSLKTYGTEQKVLYVTDRNSPIDSEEIKMVIEHINKILERE